MSFGKRINSLYFYDWFLFFVFLFLLNIGAKKVMVFCELDNNGFLVICGT